MSRNTHLALVPLTVLLALFLLDRLFPPDMTRAHRLSAEVVDREGAMLRVFLSEDGYWRMGVKAEEVSPRYLALLKAYEDKRFDSHWGVDPLALVRAASQWAGAGHIVSGASTLTMQVARLLEPRPRGLPAKAAQMVRALQLELRYSKREILSLYLTLAPFGGNLEGVRAASLAYFGKPPHSLSLSEAALLVALPQSPERLRPDRRGFAARLGRDRVLTRMVEAGAVSKGDAKVAMGDGVVSRRLAMPMVAPHLAERVVSKGARVVTTLDASLQAAVERLALREAAFFDDGAGLAIVVVENSSGAVRAYLGGADYWGAAGKLDLAARSRSPGSALKPFIYGLAFDDLVLHPATLMRDEATRFGDYAPRNFDGGFLGEVTAASALRLSLNMPAVAALEQVGPLRFTQMLENAGANLSFPAGDGAPSLPVALGGVGISLADLTMLYAGIAEGGNAKALRFVKDAPQEKPHRMFGPVAAFYLRQVLQEVSLPEGWGMGQGLTKPRAIAFKTGTSYGFRDAWSLGFSNDYIVGVWVGRADGAPRAERIGRESAAPILLKTFALLPPDKRNPPGPPRGAILANQSAQLPENLRYFSRRKLAPVITASAGPPPAISFPPNGVMMPMAEAEESIPLKATGGREPLTWLVNNRLIGSFGRFETPYYNPDSEGVTRITVVDAAGRSDTSLIRFKRQN